MRRAETRQQQPKRVFMKNWKWNSHTCIFRCTHADIHIYRIHKNVDYNCYFVCLLVSFSSVRSAWRMFFFEMVTYIWSKWATPYEMGGKKNLIEQSVPRRHCQRTKQYHLWARVVWDKSGNSIKRNTYWDDLNVCESISLSLLLGVMMLITEFTWKVSDNFNPFGVYNIDGEIRPDIATMVCKFWDFFSN